MTPTADLWSRELPLGWRVIPARRLFRIENGSTPSSGVAEYWGGSITWVTPSDLGRPGQRTIVASQRMITEEGYRSCGTSLIPAGSLVISTRAPIGHIAITGVPLCTNQGCRSLVPIGDLDPRYFYYCFAVAKAALQAFGQGSTFQELSSSDLAGFRVPVPPLGEQQAIADYLDEKTAAIDALVSKRERHIELLEEKRRSAIDELVLTRGATGNEVPTSDVPGIGRIPAQWRVVRLKFLGEVRSGITKGRAVNDSDLIDVPYLRVANVQDGFVDLEDVATIPATRDEVQRFALQAGDLLMNEGGDNDKLGRGTVWEDQINPCLHQNHVFAVRPHQGVNSYWIDLVTQTSYMRHFLLGRAKQSTNLASISATNLKEAPIVMPPPDEQNAIIKGIRAEHTKLDRLTRAITAQIQKLREYRQCLISAAVTGQIPVREEVPA